MDIAIADYLPILIFMFVALAISCLFVLANFLVAVNNPDPEKNSAYECGFEQFGDSRMKFDVRFYLVTLLFIIFDLEVAFLFPWAVTFGTLGLFIVLILNQIKKRILMPKKNQFTLDLGCGVGFWTNFLLKNCTDNIIGADISENSLNVARKRYSGNNQIKFEINQELVSNDIIGNTCASVFDSNATLTSEDGKNCVLYCWYDNEFGYTKQVIRIAKFITKVRRLIYY